MKKTWQFKYFLAFTSRQLFHWPGSLGLFRLHESMTKIVSFSISKQYFTSVIKSRQYLLQNDIGLNNKIF